MIWDAADYSGDACSAHSLLARHWNFDAVIEEDVYNGSMGRDLKNLI